VVFAAILGTGVGAGIAVRGRVLHGCNGIAGEWGTTGCRCWRASRARPTCWCGRPDCVEAWLSGPALARPRAGGRRR
jgi:fructokinase